jgi:hypothetical protein
MTLPRLICLRRTLAARFRYHCGMWLRVLVALAVVTSAPAALQGQVQADPSSTRELHEDFFQSQGSHFTVLFEGPQDHQLASRAIQVLEEAYSTIGGALATFPEGTLTVILYTRQQFQDVTHAPAWAAAAYDGKIRLPLRGALAHPEELRRVLFHELTHAMVQTIAPRRVPTWLNEGLAVMFEPVGVDWAEMQLAASPKRLSIARLASSFQGLSSQDARLAYAQSAVMARKLFDFGGGITVASILRDLAGGESFEVAFEERAFLPYDLFLGSLDPSR